MKKLRLRAIAAIAATGLLVVMGVLPILPNTAQLATIIDNPHDFPIADSFEPPAGLISWWPGDGDPYDYEGPNHGELIGDTTYAPGVVGDAFSFDGDQDGIGNTCVGLSSFVRHKSDHLP